MLAFWQVRSILPNAYLIDIVCGVSTLNKACVLGYRSQRAAGPIEGREGMLYQCVVVSTRRAYVYASFCLSQAADRRVASQQAQCCRPRRVSRYAVSPYLPHRNQLHTNDISCTVALRRLKLYLLLAGTTVPREVHRFNSYFRRSIVVEGRLAGHWHLQ